MMKTRLIFILLSWLKLTAFAQNGYDNIDKEIALNGIRFGDDIEVIRQALGEPDTLITFYSEMEGTTIEELQYGNSTLQILNGEFYGFELNDGNIKLLPYDLCVGTLESELERLFPNSYQKIDINSGGSKILRTNLYDSYIIFYLEGGFVRSIYTFEPS